ncbi:MULTISPECIES: helix-turn-helix transcriptional regulator [unclassified Streptomyces]|uniref:helix-turn-helix domain-containing protein n=1 Tax=unclassified Streptomyces TaxID=2593676 RepID=UPI00081D46E4|nr:MULTISPECIES: helix-turn-helix transcriptional regulator [unclassified Streptomyces]MYZ36200.1 helix-turn-helix domain-containing protein [Streptomyces sp. SID4917]SCF81688.1 Helix-turn-helix domain-containing protein [Streptomyces sp. MnatMP-M17]
MPEARKPRTLRQMYGEELKLRRIAAGMTQEMLSDIVVCSPTLISHFEAGRRLPNPDDAKRIDAALGTDGFFARWLEDLESRYADFFAAVAELELQATEIRQYGSTLIPGLLQTDGYSRAVFRTHGPNHTAEELDQKVVVRRARAKIFDGPLAPVVWTLLDEACLRRKVGGAAVMAEQLLKIVGMAEAGRLRFHVLPFGAGAHALQAGMLYLMDFQDAPPVAYAEGHNVGYLMDDPAMVQMCQMGYNLALSDALPQQDSLALVRAIAKEYEGEQE